LHQNQKQPVSCLRKAKKKNQVKEEEEEDEEWGKGEGTSVFITSTWRQQFGALVV